MEFLISSRTSRPGDDPIFSLNAEAKQRKAAGETIVNATVGALLLDSGKLAVLAGVAEALRAVPADRVAGYAPIAGLPEFLSGTADDLLRGRPERDFVASVATPGGTGALRHAIANFLEPQQTLLTSSYYWSPYKTLADECDRNLSTFRMFNAEGHFDATDFDSKLGSILEAQGRALIILNSPCHNPTGYSYDAGEWQQIVDIVTARSKQGPISVLLDVAYAKYGAQGMDTMLDAMLSLSGKALVLFAWSASKAFLQYGIRVGSLIAVHPDAGERSRIQNALTYSCRGTWSNVNAGGMAGIANVLNDAELRSRVEDERALLKGLLDSRVALWNKLAANTPIVHPRYDGGFFTTVFCNQSKEIAALLRQEGLFVVPLQNALRVALCAVSDKDIPKIVEAIARLLPKEDHKKGL